jgi:hypothetical protein
MLHTSFTIDARTGACLGEAGHGEGSVERLQVVLGWGRMMVERLVPSGNQWPHRHISQPSSVPIPTRALPERKGTTCRLQTWALLLEEEGSL